MRAALYARYSSDNQRDASIEDQLRICRAAQSLGSAHRYHQRVFMAPPWPEIYVMDAERQHGFEEAKAEYERLMIAFPALG